MLLRPLLALALVSTVWLWAGWCEPTENEALVARWLRQVAGHPLRCWAALWLGLWGLSRPAPQSSNDLRGVEPGPFL